MSHRLPDRYATLAFFFASALLLSTEALSQREHALMPSPETVHVGNFNAALKPVLTVESGDIVMLESAGAIEPVRSINPVSRRPAPCPTMCARSTRSKRSRSRSRHMYRPAPLR